MATRPPEPGEPDDVVHDYPDDPEGGPAIQESEAPNHDGTQGEGGADRSP